MEGFISHAHMHPHNYFPCYSLIIPLIQLKQNTNIRQSFCYEENNRPKTLIECIFAVHTALAKPVSSSPNKRLIIHDLLHVKINDDK